jgi:hypothetical protein
MSIRIYKKSDTESYISDLAPVSIPYPDLFPGSAWEYRLEAPASLSQVAGATQTPFPGRAWEREQANKKSSNL